MTNDEIAKILLKMQFQIRIIGQAIDFDRNPLEALIMSMDWGREDLDKAHDVFEKWDVQLASGDKLNQSAFEQDFSDTLGINYQGLKSIIICFYRDGVWTKVIEAYVDSFVKGQAPMEYKEIECRSG